MWNVIGEVRIVEAKLKRKGWHWGDLYKIMDKLDDFVLTVSHVPVQLLSLNKDCILFAEHSWAAPQSEIRVVKEQRL